MDKCFIIMPVTTHPDWIPFYGGDKDHFKHVLDHLLCRAVKKAGFEPVPPKAKGADVIQAHIIQQIEAAALVLCDMSRLNANVFFELGIRTAVNKPVCLVVDELVEKVPFDLTVVNYHTYQSSLAPWLLEKEVDDLAQHITDSVTSSNQQNVMWQRFALQTNAKLPPADTSMSAQLERLRLEIEAMRSEHRNSEWTPLSVPSEKGKLFWEYVKDEIRRLFKASMIDVYSIGTSPKTNSVAITYDAEDLPENLRHKLDILANAMKVAIYADCGRVDGSWSFGKAAIPDRRRVPEAAAKPPLSEPAEAEGTA